MKQLHIQTHRGMHVRSSHTQSFKDNPVTHFNQTYLGKIKLGTETIHGFYMLSIHSLPLLFICESCHKSMSTDPLVFGIKGLVDYLSEGISVRLGLICPKNSQMGNSSQYNFRKPQ